MRPGFMSAAGALVLAATASAQEAPPVTAPGASIDRIIVNGMVPIPDVGEGAPYYSIEQLDATLKEAHKQRSDSMSAARRCQAAVAKETRSSRAPTMEVLLREQQDAAFGAELRSQEARAATEAAEKSRLDAGAGLVDHAAVEKAELDRQAAINKLDLARVQLLEASAAVADYEDLKLSGRIVEWFDLDDRADRRRKAGWGLNGPPPQEFAGLRIQAIKVQEFTDPKKGKFVRVSGEIHNERDKPATTPGMKVSLIDARGWIVGAQTQGASNGEKLKPGSVKPFVFDMRPAPESMEKALVTFASEMEPPPLMPTGVLEECRGITPDQEKPLVRGRGLPGSRTGRGG